MTGEMLRAARLQKGWTQAQAAHEFGVSQGYVALLEGGARQPSAGLRLVMVKKLGLPPTAVPLVQGRPADSDRLAAGCSPSRSATLSPTYMMFLYTPVTYSGSCWS